MLKKELKAALAVMGVIAPFAAHADQTGMSGQAKNKPLFDAGESVKTGVLPGAYSEAASYRIDDGYDLYFTADFIYWALQQDLVRVGTQLVPASGTGALSFLTGTDSVEFQNAYYKPGFQVGAGFAMKGMDYWNAYAEYTWYQNSHTTSQTGIIPIASTTLNLPSGVLGNLLTSGGLSFENKFHYNNGELTLQRPFYLGRKLTANFGAGLRTLWITQNLDKTATGLTQYTGGTTTAGTALSGSLSSAFRQKSWSLGPKFVFGADWLLGYGFKIQTNLAASVLYTRYTSLEATLSGTATSVTGAPAAKLTVNESSGYNVLRAVTDSSLNLAWGSYFGDNDDFHVDISAGYDFNIYWNQNMYGVVVNGQGAPTNTYLHGLNVAVRFDF